MSLLDTASLIVTPNGVKEGKLYSVIPSDGSGDMSVVRATTATRVNSAGLVELVPYNLLTYSNTFSNAAWTKTNTTVTSGQSGYDGTSNAWKLQATATNNCEVDQGFSESETKNFSIYAKAGNVNFVAISVFGAGYGWYNLSNGTLGSSGGTFVSRNIESVGNGWYRCSIVTNVAASGVAVYVCNADNSTAASIGSNIFIQNSQFVEGSVAKDYQKTETRLNIPRLDYSNGTCPSLLVEPQRTNLLTYSSSFDNAIWAKDNASVTANTTTSPDGTQNADSLIENGANDHHLIYQGDNPVAGSYSASVFIKKNTRQYAFLQIATDTAVNRYTIVVDLNNGTMTASSTYGSPTGTSYKIDSMGNGWYRLSVTATHTAGLLYNVFGLSNSGTPTFNFVAIPTYVGDGTSSAYFWGAQLEAGSYPTSYIPTTSASVTRNADVISKTGISSLIGQTEWTLFWEGQGNTQSTGDDLWIFGASVNDTSTAVLLYYVHSSGYINCFINNGSSFVILDAPMTITDNNKVAIGYKSGDFVMYVNGAQVDSNTSATAIPSTMNQVAFNKWQGATGVQKQLTKAAALWKTRLTNAQLATLTTI